ncbi:hypothetical protein KC352_g27692, partial [Hortaea werneckii]
KCEAILDTFDSVETMVHASFYRVGADYYQQSNSFADYYRTTLLYLACVELEEMQERERQRLAYDLSIAALVSDSIYNFGELLLHPILDSLTKTEHAWLRDLLFAFNRGDLGAYQILQNHLNANRLLQQHQEFLYQKISLSALTQLVFSRSPQDRSMTFQTISDETKVAPDEIEHLIMKALSLGLLKGQIDQVAEVARISWVQPKVLGREGIEGMRTRLTEWDSGVSRLGNWVEGIGQDVWAAMTTYTPTPLFGGALAASLPSTFGDVSDIRQVPDHQEVWLDRDGYTSVVFEILERVEKGSDEEALKYHLEDLVEEEDMGRMKVWGSNTAFSAKLPPQTPAYTLFATSPPGEKQRGRAHEPDFVGILLTMVRLVEQQTDLLIAINVPHVKGEYEESEVDFAGGKYGKLMQQAMEYRERVLETFEVKDWGLFVME